MEKPKQPEDGGPVMPSVGDVIAAAAEKPKLKLENKVDGCQTVDIRTLRPFQGGAKGIRKANLNRLKRSLLERGIVAPVFTWDGWLLDGHQRQTACAELQAEGVEVPPFPFVPVLAGSIEEARKILLAFIGHYGDVSHAGLEQWVKEHGIDAADVRRWADLPLENLLKAGIVGDAPVRPGECRVKPGELWKLGEHRLIVGDSTDPGTWARLMGDEKAQLCFTDPPYGIDYHSRGERLKGEGKDSLRNDAMGDPEFRALLTGFARCMLAHLKPDAGVYVCYSSSTHIAFEQSLVAAGLEIRSQIIWVKALASMGWGDVEDRLEVSDEKVFAQIGGRTFEISGTDLKVQCLHQGKTTVWKEARESNYRHPTQKPVELIRNALINSSREGDCVADPFAGSGSTMMACEKAKRRCYAIELDPAFASGILDAWEKLTGGKAELISEQPAAAAVTQ